MSPYESLMHQVTPNERLILLREAIKETAQEMGRRNKSHERDMNALQRKLNGLQAQAEQVAAEIVAINKDAAAEREETEAREDGAEIADALLERAHGPYALLDAAHGDKMARSIGAPAMPGGRCA